MNAELPRLQIKYEGSEHVSHVLMCVTGEASLHHTTVIDDDHTIIEQCCFLL